MRLAAICAFNGAVVVGDGGNRRHERRGKGRSAQHALAVVGQRRPDAHARCGHVDVAAAIGVAVALGVRNRPPSPRSPLDRPQDSPAERSGPPLPAAATNTMPRRLAQIGNAAVQDIVVGPDEAQVDDLGTMLVEPLQRLQQMQRVGHRPAARIGEEGVGDQEIGIGDEPRRAAGSRAREQREHARAVPIRRPVGLVSAET